MGEKKKSRKWLGSVIYLLVCGLIGVLLGILLAANDAAFEPDPLFLLAVLVSFAAAMYLHVILHEAGHAFFGMLTGYKFLSYRVGSFMWERGKDGKVRFSRFSLAGTGGQCLMSPPEYNGGDFPYVWYNLGGGLVNLILAALSGLALLAPVGKYGAVFLWLMILTGVIFGGSNLLPIPGGKLNNDGSNILSISKSPAARQAFWLQMKCNEQIAWGVRPKDLPDEYFPDFPEESRKNAMVMSMEVMRVSRLMDAQRFEDAKAAYRALADDPNVMAIYRNLIAFDLAWLELYFDRPGKMAEKVQGKEMMSFAKAMKDYPAILRTQYALALLLDKDEAKAAGLRQRFDKRMKRYPHESEAIGERELMDLMDERYSHQ